jgi:ABC-type sugar transport system substrate-binding protein
MDKVVRPFAFIAMAAGLLLGATACAGATNDPTQGGSANSSGPLTIGVTIHQADQYFQTVANGVETAAKADNGSSVLVNTQVDPATEATGIQNLISRQVSGIVTSPLSPTGSVASIKAAHDAGIPIVCYNTCLGDDSEKYAAAFIQSDQKDLGTQTGTFAAADLKKRGISTATVGMLNCNRYEACKDRQNGFLEALKAGGVAVTVVGDQEALAPDEASKKATDILTANPDINVFWSASQGASEGMVAAVKASGKSDISLYATDVSPTLIQSIKNGELRALTGQDSTKTGQLAVDYIKEAIRGEKPDKFVTSLPGVLYNVDAPAELDKYLASSAKK